MRPARPGGALVIAVLLLALFPKASTLKWLALSRLASVATISSADTCDHLTGLITRQVQICKRNMEMMESVRSGAQRAIDECQFQFRTRRWNCTTLQDGRVFGNALTPGTRESAFVHALSAAGVAHAVTRACSSGEVDKCGCDRTIRGGARTDEGFHWSGCSDNVAFGTAFSRAFVDAREVRATKGKKGSSPKALVNLHNNEAGRKLLEQKMRVECKCHGVSGSCELKTCWRAMPTFREIGEVLKEKFDGATEVQPRRFGSHRQLVPTNVKFKRHTDLDLVYIDGSPDYCEYDPAKGSLGTRGRRCNKTSKAIDGCDLLCCGRGYKTHREREVERCACKFHWCCYVSCKECSKEVEVHTCL